MSNENDGITSELVESCECVIDPSVKEIVIVKEEDGEGEEKKERIIKTIYPSLKEQSIPLIVSNIIISNHVSSSFILLYIRITI